MNTNKESAKKAQFVKTMDKLDMGLQAMNYQQQGLTLVNLSRVHVQEPMVQNSSHLNEAYKPTRTKTRTSAHRLQPDGVVVHHGGFWSRRPRFESESGYFQHTQLHQSVSFRSNMAIQNIAVLGAGQMGNGITQVAAAAVTT